MLGTNGGSWQPCVRSSNCRFGLCLDQKEATGEIRPLGCAPRRSTPRRSVTVNSARLRAEGYTATRHQREVGAGYFDEIAKVVSGGTASTLALLGSTEEEQFEDREEATG